MMNLCVQTINLVSGVRLIIICLKDMAVKIIFLWIYFWVENLWTAFCPIFLSLLRIDSMLLDSL